MKASKFTEAQKAFMLKQAEDGTPVAEVCRKVGISDATFYNWRKRYAGLMPSEMKRLRQLEEENAELKRIVADLSWRRGDDGTPIRRRGGDCSRGKRLPTPIEQLRWRHAHLSGDRQNVGPGLRGRRDRALLEFVRPAPPRRCAGRITVDDHLDDMECSICRHRRTHRNS
jgi:putative transposase